MPRRSALLFVFLFVPLLLAKDEPTLPKLVANAKFVLVTTYFGDQANPRIPPDDRQAVADVERAIQEWGRYTLVYKRKDADLILLVRKRRSAMSQEGINIHAGSGQHSVGSITNGDFGDPLDMLAVYDASQGTDSAPLWRGRKSDGLKAPEMELVNEFRSKVEATAKRP